jgi:hypothetical protein
MSESSFEQYKIFMKRMAGLFMGKEATAALHIDQMTRQGVHPKTVEEERERTALTTDRKSEVKDLRTFSQSDTKKGLCSSDQKDKVIPLDTDTKQNVHAVVRKLFERQMNHAAKCEGILRQMFSIRREENLPVQIKISDVLLKGGVAALNKINSQVRQILIEYYSDCESMYLVGVRHIEHQGILKRQKEDAQKKQAELIQKQAVEKAAAQAQAQAPVQRQVPRGPPVAATGPPPPKDAYIPPDPASNHLTIVERQALEAKAAQAKVAQAALTVAQQAAQRGQRLTSNHEYIDAIKTILREKFSGEKSATNTAQSIRTYLETHRIPVEQVRLMSKEQLRGLLTTETGRMTRGRAAAAATRTAGGTRKNITSSFRTTRRLLR